ncbi:TonB-dependent siderophore receptor [uncultured Castellaniella sp.]|uniref:TonB-dependent receptor n=1 Tax=uncultured Castellaniella sp. TaxID=647907 RepID=UPI002630CE23|nr:TonB-dependent siderophore receptor [uncultured Castellaniella sp.]
MEDTLESRTGKLAGGLATALATPGLFLLPQAAQAQNTDPAQLSPIKVQGENPAPFLVKESASDKFTAPVLDTAKSLQIIPKELIQSQAATTLTDVLRNSPGITFGAGEGGNPLGDRPFIRGYDAQSSTFIDGMRDIGATSREVFNLEQVEVIKGADGAYAGRGGAGGSIDLISKTAKLRDFTDVSAGFGTSKYFRQTVDSNWQLGDTTAFRLNAMNHSQDVDGRDAVDYKRWGVAPTISFGLGTPTRVTLSYFHMEADDTPDSGIPYTISRNGSNDPRFHRTPVDVDRDNFYGLDSDYRRTRNDMGTLRVEHDFSDRLTLRNQTRYTRGTQRYIVTQPDDSKGNVNDGLVWRRANTRDSRVSTWANQTELLGEFRTGQLKHRFLTGIELSVEDGRKDSLDIDRGKSSCPAGVGAAGNYTCTSLYNPNPGDPWVNSGSGGPIGEPTYTRTLTKSIYGFDTIELNERWQTTLGLRLDNYATRVDQFSGNRVDRQDTLLNYQLGLVYKPAENGSIYLSYGTSSTPAGAGLNEGSGNSVTPGGRTPLNAADTAPEKNRTMELGTKWDVLDGLLGLTAAVFRVETTNARITDANGLYSMAGDKHVDGFELGFSGSITPQWQVYGGYTYLKSRIGNDGKTGAASNEGKVFPNTPESSFSLWNTYAFTPKFTAGVGAYYVDKQYGNEANTITIPSYWRFDAMAGYQFNKTVDLQINVNNLFNKTYYDKAYASHYASIAPGRSAVATLNLHF